MRKSIFFTILSLLLIPTIVKASPDIFISINCKKNILAVGETTNCELIANSDKEYSSFAFDLTGSSLDFLNKQGANGFTKNGSNFISETNKTGETVFATFDVKATSANDTYIYVTNLLAKDTNNTVLGTNTAIAPINITQDEYTYEYEYDESTGTSEITLYKNGNLLPSGTPISIYADENYTTAISTSLTSYFSTTYKVNKDQTLYGTSTTSGTTTNFTIKDNLVKKPNFLINKLDNVIELELLNKDNNATYKLYRNNTLINNNVDSSLVNGTKYIYKYVAELTDEDGYKYTRENEKQFFLHEAPTFTIKELNEDQVVITLTKTDNVRNYYVSASLTKEFNDNFFAAQVTPEESSVLIENIPLNTPVYYMVQAEFTDSVRSGWSNPVEFTNVDLTMANPTNVKATLVTSTNPINISLTYNKVEHADGYYIKQGTTKIGETTNTSYTINNIKYGVNYAYTITAYRCTNIACTETVETSPVSTNTVKATPVKQALTVTQNGRYDQYKLVIAKPILVTANNNIKYQIYRAKAGSSYALVKTITNAPLTAYTYVDTIGGPVINATYNYKVIVTIDSAAVMLDIKSVKATIPVPTITSLVNNTNTTQQLVFTNRGANLKYEVYQATSKKGKYKKKCDGTSTVCNLKSIKWNKTYYYKVRAYYMSGKKKVYTGYSAIISRKMTAIALDKYPLTYRVNGTTDIIKSVTVTKSGSKFSFKIKHTKTISSKAQTVKYRVRLYNHNKTQYKDVWLSVKLKKGTKSNQTTTTKVTVPGWATQYDFM